MHAIERCIATNDHITRLAVLDSALQRASNPDLGDWSEKCVLASSFSGGRGEVMVSLPFLVSLFLLAMASNLSGKKTRVFEWCVFLRCVRFLCALERRFLGVFCACVHCFWLVATHMHFGHAAKRIYLCGVYV